MKPRQFTNGNIDTQLKMISSRKKTKQNQILFQDNLPVFYRGLITAPFLTKAVEFGKNADSAAFVENYP